MRYLLSNLPLNLGEEALDLARPLAHALGGTPADYRAVILERRSLDARHKGAIRFLTAISFESDRALNLGPLPGGLKLDLAPVTAPYAVAAPPRRPSPLARRRADRDRPAGGAAAGRHDRR